MADNRNMNNQLAIIDPNIKDYNYEKTRFESFEFDWPHCYISPKILAKTGFYFLGPYDRVKCQFCFIDLCSWEMGDNEVDEHLRWSPHCPLLKRQQTMNIPIERDALECLLPKKCEDECGIYTKEYELYLGRKRYSYSETPSTFFADRKPTQYVQFRDFMDKTKRLNTFKDWPRNKEQTPELLSSAGFFHTQKEDRVICFSCGCGLSNWMEGEDVWEQHAMAYGKCEYMSQTKGSEYINLVKQKFARN